MKKQRDRIVFMAEMALLIALILLMAFTPIGYSGKPRGGCKSRLSWYRWRLALLVVLVVVALGLVFGLTSFANAFTSAIGTTLMQENAVYTFILAVVPRILVGCCRGFCMPF